MGVKNLLATVIPVTAALLGSGDAFAQNSDTGGDTGQSISAIEQTRQAIQPVLDEARTIRYVEDGALSAAAPDETSSTGAGDCKDKAADTCWNLLKQGINATQIHNFGVHAVCALEFDGDQNGIPETYFVEEDGVLKAYRTMRDIFPKSNSSSKFVEAYTDNAGTTVYWHINGDFERIDDNEFVITPNSAPNSYTEPVIRQTTLDLLPAVVRATWAEGKTTICYSPPTTNVDPNSTFSDVCDETAVFKDGQLHRVSFADGLVNHAFYDGGAIYQVDFSPKSTLLRWALNDTGQSTEQRKNQLWYGSNWTITPANLGQYR